MSSGEEQGREQAGGGLVISPLPEGVEPGKVQVKVIEQFNNPLLQRKEVKAIVYHVGLPTPQRLQLREELAKALGSNPELTYVTHVYTQYGVGVSRIEVHVYFDKNTAELVEPLYVRLRNMPKDQAKKIRDELKSRRKSEKKPAAKGK
ncbi:30S ribosomal protein S24e [Caldivirga maquilingensis]|nr:30S ribosomal protein S24 [Caldivirga maquilingensis]